MENKTQIYAHRTVHVCDTKVRKQLGSGPGERRFVGRDFPRHVGVPGGLAAAAAWSGVGCGIGARGVGAAGSGKGCAWTFAPLGSCAEFHH